MFVDWILENGKVMDRGKDERWEITPHLRCKRKEGGIREASPLVAGLYSETVGKITSSRVLRVQVFRAGSHARSS